jgi:hypothetical protein
MKDKKVKQFLSKGWYHWEGGGHNEMVKEGKYGGCILYFVFVIWWMYENRTMKPVEIVLRRRREDKEERWKGETN